MREGQLDGTVLPSMSPSLHRRVRSQPRAQSPELKSETPHHQEKLEDLKAVASSEQDMGSLKAAKQLCEVWGVLFYF